MSTQQVRFRTRTLSLGAEVSGEIIEEKCHFALGQTIPGDVKSKGLSGKQLPGGTDKIQEIFSTWGQSPAEPEGAQEP